MSEIAQFQRNHRSVLLLSKLNKKRCSKTVSVNTIVTKSPFQTFFSFKILTNYGIYKIMFRNFIKITDLTQFHQHHPSKSMQIFTTYLSYV